MARSLPPLPKPEFCLISIESPPEIPDNIARELLDPGIPRGLIGYEYRPLAEPVLLAGRRSRGLVDIATSGLAGRVCIDPSTGEVVQIPEVGSTTIWHVNKNLSLFARCVEAVIGCFPFYQEGEEDGFEGAADDIRDVVLNIDETAFNPNGFWDTLYWGICMGDYPDWDS